MKASAEEIRALEKIQELDRIVFKSHKDLKNLPQPKEAQGVHARLEEVSGKLSQVDAMLGKKRRDYESLSHEDWQLEEKLARVQEKIDSAEGDYRRVQTWVRDMEIMVERRNKLSHKMSKLLDEIDQIEKVREQAAQGAEALKARERKLYDEFNAQGSALKAEIQRSQEDQKQLAKQVSPELMKRYIASVQRFGGIGLARLADDCSCSACRNKVSKNKLPEVKRNAPIAECPSCGRLLIVE